MKEEELGNLIKPYNPNMKNEHWYITSGTRDIGKSYASSFIGELQQENQQLQNNWNELKKWVNRYYDYYMNNEDFIGGRLCFTDIKNKMQELEGKSE